MGQSADRPNPISPPNGGRSPPNKNHFCQGPRAQNFQGSGWGREPPKGANSKKCHAPKIFDPHFLEKIVPLHISKISGIKGDLNVCRFQKFIQKSFVRIFRKMKNKQNSLRGAWPPNLTPDSHVHRNLSRARLGAHDPEKISEIARMVAEKIEFKAKTFGAPWRTNRK